MRMPPLETPRLLIRPFTMADLAAVHHLLDVELADADFGIERPDSLEQRAAWLQWTVLNEDQLARLYQLPYGDRAVILRATGDLIGACGFVPSLGPFHLLDSAAQDTGDAAPRYQPEVGLYYAFSPAHQRRGYATEAAGALVAHAFSALHLRRVVATTTSDNTASIRVMEKLGMRVVRHPLLQTPGYQVVGVIDAPVDAPA